jgi:hypothetical protein
MTNLPGLPMRARLRSSQIEMAAGIYVMPAIGGLSLRISTRGSAEGLQSPQWSSDGAELAYLRREGEGTFIDIVSLSTRESRR